MSAVVPRNLTGRRVSGAGGCVRCMLACEKLWECHGIRLATASRWFLGSVGINRSHKRLAASFW
jgi:hypothetical protein